MENKWDVLSRTCQATVGRSICKATRLSENIKRSRAVSHAVLNEYFDNLEVTLANVSPDHLVNYDETNFVGDNDNYLHESNGSEYVASDSASVIEESNYEDQNENIQPESEDHENDNHLPINNESLTSRGTKRIKSFPVKQKTAKNRIRDPESWKKNAAAMCREKGKGSISYKGNVPPKNFCSGCLCTEQCRLKCSTKFEENTLKSIFNDFYNLDIKAKNALLFKSIIPVAVARKRKNAPKNKAYSYKYSMILKNEVVFVCKTAFCSLHQISRKKVDIIKNKQKTGKAVPSKDRRGRHMNRPHKMSDAVEQAIIKHIIIIIIISLFMRRYSVFAHVNKLDLTRRECS
jgi:hypothetical protein